jgi:hypothetical protein
VFTRALYWSLSCARWIRFISPHLSKILVSWWCLYFWLSHQKRCADSSSHHGCYMPCPSHPPSLDHSNLAKITSYGAPHHRSVPREYKFCSSKNWRALEMGPKNKMVSFSKRM